MLTQSEYSKLVNGSFSHSVSSIAPNEKDIEIRVILIEKLGIINLKSGDVIHQFLVADQTGSIKCNFFGEHGQQLKTGYIVVLTGVYSALYKEMTLTLNTGKRSKIYKTGEFFMSFVEEPKMSESIWEKNASGNYIFKR